MAPRLSYFFFFFAAFFFVAIVKFLLKNLGPRGRLHRAAKCCVASGLHPRYCGTRVAMSTKKMNHRDAVVTVTAIGIAGHITAHGV